MSSWDFNEVGRFSSERAAEEFAKRNNIDPLDMRTRKIGGQFELEIRRTALGSKVLSDDGEGRNTGWS